MIDVKVVSRDGKKSHIRCVTDFDSEDEAVIEILAVLDRIIESNLHLATVIASLFANACKKGQTTASILEATGAAKTKKFSDQEIERYIKKKMS